MVKLVCVYLLIFYFFLLYYYVYIFGLAEGGDDRREWGGCRPHPMGTIQDFTGKDSLIFS